MTNLMRRLSAVGAIIIVSLAFALPHLNSLIEAPPLLIGIGLINLFLMSSILALVMLTGGRLWMAAGLHMMWNFGISVLFGLDVSGFSTPHLVSLFPTGQDIFTGGGFGPEASILTLPVFAITLIFLIVIYRKQKREEVLLGEGENT